MTIPVSVPGELSFPGVAQTRGCTTVKVVALLFAETGSVVDVLTVLVFVSVVGVAGAVTVIATVIVVPRVIAPKVHVTLAVCVQEPCVVEAETNVVLAGMVSVNVPSAEFDKPRS